MLSMLLAPWGAGILLSLITGPLGCIIMWRRMAYFGDMLAHASLLGLLFSICLHIAPLTGIVLLVVLIAIGVGFLEHHSSVPIDTLLGIFAHGTLGLGLAGLSLFPGIRVDLMNYLFGDLLAVTFQDFGYLCFGIFLILMLLRWRWSKFLIVSISPEIAYADGIAPYKERLMIMVIIGLTIAFALRITGALLVTSLLVVPAATARNFSNTPEQMAVFASLSSMLAVTLGLAGSFVFDTPAGASIVVIAVILFVLSFFKKIMIRSA